MNRYFKVVLDDCYEYHEYCGAFRVKAPFNPFVDFLFIGAEGQDVEFVLRVTDDMYIPRAYGKLLEYEHSLKQDDIYTEYAGIITAEPGYGDA